MSSEATNNVEKAYSAVADCVDLAQWLHHEYSFTLNATARGDAEAVSSLAKQAAVIIRDLAGKLLEAFDLAEPLRGECAKVWDSAACVPGPDDSYHQKAWNDAYCLLNFFLGWCNARVTLTRRSPAQERSASRVKEGTDPDKNTAARIPDIREIQRSRLQSNLRSKLPTQEELIKQWPRLCKIVKARYNPRPICDELTGMLAKEARIVRAKQETPRSGSFTVVSVDLKGNTVMIKGHCRSWSATPHLCRMLSALVDAKTKEADPYVLGAELKQLPGCHGKNVSREIGNLKREIPPLKKLLKSDKHLGYWLNG